MKVEHRLKQMAPWFAMYHGSLLAQQSLLLDYLPPWNIQVLPHALKVKHYPVALGIFGSLSIRILIVISAGEAAVFVALDKSVSLLYVYHVL